MRFVDDSCMLETGVVAPDFVLLDQHGQSVVLSSFRNKSLVLLVFYPLAFSNVCTDEFKKIRDGFSFFVDFNVEVLAVSVDSKFSLQAFAVSENYQFSLLSDFWPHGKVTKQYGLLNEGVGFAARGTYLIGFDGVIRERFFSVVGEERSFERYREAVLALK